MKISLPLPPNMANSPKKCTGCGKVKPLDEFRTDRECRSGRGAQCKPCVSRAAVDYAKRHPEQRRKYSRQYHALNRQRVLGWNLKKHYGITVDDYTRMLTAQDGQCAICGRQFGNKKADCPNVDHCHASGKVRGLLCYHCNYMLGCAKDDPTSLESAAHYLRSGQ